MNGRRSTIHDVAALRLHPDGSRVATGGKSKAKKQNKRIIQDHRGNWVAQDAAGLAGIKRRRAAADDEQDKEAEGEVFDLTGVDELMKDAEKEDKGKQRADDMQDEGDSQRRGRSTKKAKRQRFVEDLSFIGGSHTGDLDASSGASLATETYPSGHVSSRDLTEVNALPNPSSVSPLAFTAMIDIRH